MNKFEKLAALIKETDLDAQRAYAGNKAAGRRVREAMMTVKALAQDVRVEMLAIRG